MKKFQLCAFADEADASVAGQIQALHANEISYIELRGVEQSNVLDLTVSQMRALRQQLDAEGIRVWSLGSPIGKVSLDNDFDAYCDTFRHALELANLAGARNMRIFSFFVSDDMAPACKNQVIDRLGRFAELAEGSGVTLCHENEKGIYGTTASRCLDLHQAVPSLKAVFDPANFVQVGQETLSAWAMLEPYIHYMHIKDVDSNDLIVPAGKGVGNIPQLLENYAAIGGTVLTLEPHLAEFVGLANLEQPGQLSNVGMQFTSLREAFDHGVNALKALL